MNQPALAPFSGLSLQAKGWEVDGETGFLLPAESGPGYGAGPSVLLTPTLKKTFLNKLQQCWPRIYEALELIGVARETVRNHLAVDGEFKRQYDEIVQRHIDGVEGALTDNAVIKGSVLAEIALMNAYRREQYQPTMKVEVTQTIDHHVIVERAKSLGMVIDGRLSDSSD